MRAVVARDPFDPVASAEAYVPREATEEAYTALRSCVFEDARIGVLAGPAGLGKTLLLRRLGAEAPSRGLEAIYLPYADLSPEGLARWALSTQGAESLEDTAGLLGACLQHLRSEGSGMLLLIDDASALPVETARWLVELAARSQGTLRVALALLDGPEGEPVIEALGSAADVTLLAQPMSHTETRAYLEARLRASGAPSAQRALFDEARVAELHRMSRGNPRRLQAAALAVCRGARPEAIAAFLDGAEPDREARDEAAQRVRATAASAARRAAEATLEQLGLAPDEDEPSAEAAEPGEPAQAAPPPREPAAAEPEPVEAPPATPVAESRAEGPLEAALREPDAVLSALRRAVEPAPASEPGVEPVRAGRARPPGRSAPTPRAGAAPAADLHAATERALAEAEAALAEAEDEDTRMALGKAVTALHAALQAEARPARTGEPRAGPRIGWRPPQLTGAQAVTLALGASILCGVLAISLLPDLRSGLLEGLRGAPTEARSSRRAAASPAPEAAERQPPVRPSSPEPAPAELRAPPEPEPPERAPPVAAPAEPPRPAEPAPRAPARPAVPAQETPALAEPARPAPERAPAEATSASVVTVGVNATPWARIQVDGRDVGETPIADLRLPPGSYRFRAEMPDGRILERQVEVGPETQSVVFP